MTLGLPSAPLERAIVQTNCLKSYPKSARSIKPRKTKKQALSYSQP